ncbi:hypothetical protein LCGC14_2743910 [marine sediment metagenome]|uniref:Uncharacterized protein n=1 Tax=marine sediment metagenome TaxID=412755 RepID=A0A0F8Z3Q8_9ZZZZ
MENKKDGSIFIDEKNKFLKTMNNKDAGKIVSLLWNDILIANWFDKEWFEETYKIILNEDQYKQIVEEYNFSNMPDVITKEIQEWIADNDIIAQALKE